MKKIMKIFILKTETRTKNSKTCAVRVRKIMCDVFLLENRKAEVMWKKEKLNFL